MQGRLSPSIDNKIQAFPHNYWKNEFHIAKEIGFELIEWIVDDENNPIFDDEQIEEILKLSDKFGIKINSLCADIFMEKYLFKSSKKQINQNMKILEKLIYQCQKSKIKIIELPFVDSSSLENLEHQEEVIKNLKSIKTTAEECNIILGLETDLPPDMFVKLLEKMDSPNIKANYDIGNSISKNYDPSVELDILKKWIVNVHVKDRYKNGKTVPLGSGDVNFREFFQKLNKINYNGDLIIQGAREDLVENTPVKNTCSKYLEFINRYLEKRIE
tara:strand:+ start:52 stop:870 length:819 start_codon:yes stop_codon:yes gene_type:complete